MKYVKTIGASLAIFAASLPLVAQAQTATEMTVIGNITAVSEGIIIERGDVQLTVVEGSSVLAGDTIHTFEGAGTFNVNADGQILCSQALTTNTTVSVVEQNTCETLATMTQVSSENVVLASRVGGTAPMFESPLFVLGATGLGLAGVISIADSGNNSADDISN